ncbi:MAG: Abi family protein [Chitinophagales bacterium]|nr:Abi family protein [Chitinophagales bacterium]
MNFNKPPISIPDQISLLKKRGLLITDETKAAHYLSNISYYRLRAYTYPFQDNSVPDHPFVKQVSFDDIIDLYVFDRRLRLLVFDGLEKIEIALRTKIIYHYSVLYGSHWHENISIYRSQSRVIRDLGKLYEEIDRSNETFIKHYKNTYTQPPNPPSWMSLEVASMGLLSKLFENLKLSPDKKEITKSFGLSHPFILESWMHAFAQLRNICAHHGRLWNRRFTTTPKIPDNSIHPYLNNKKIYPNKIYAILSSMTYILHIISPGNTFNTRLKELMKSCKLTDEKEMGFPENWLDEPIWK